MSQTELLHPTPPPKKEKAVLARWAGSEDVTCSQRGRANMCPAQAGPEITCIGLWRGGGGPGGSGPQGRRPS